MNKLYLQPLHNMESTLADLVKRVPEPQCVPMLYSFTFRYMEKSIHQALIQKLARVVSGLYAAQILLESGFLQEQGAIHRMLDEIVEDIVFLSFGAINEVTKLHQNFLNDFYEEEFDKPENPISSTQKRPMIPRKKIRAYIARMEGSGLDPSTGTALTNTLSKAYSGFVHGASPHIMDMYGGNPPHFHVAGMRGTPRFLEHQHDLWNYFYRGICAFGFAAKAFGDEHLFGTIRYYLDNFHNQSQR